MSYSCQYQNEIQSALWSRASVTMLTGIITENGKTKSLLICSDIKGKDKTTVFACIMYIYDYTIKPYLLLKETEVVFLSAEYIRNMVDIITPWEDIERVPGISRMHIIECSEGKVSIWENATFKDTMVAKSPYDKSIPTKFVKWCWVD